MDSCSGFSSSRVSHIGVVVRFSRYNTAHQNLRAEVDYVNGLREELQGQLAASQDGREQFAVLVQQCRNALKSAADYTD